MSGLLDYVAEAIRLLRDQADAVHESHNAPGETTFEGEPEAEAAYAELERVANGLETEIAARLRGEAAQSEQQAVAWLLPSGELFTAEQLEDQRRAYGDTFGLLAKPLYTHPQPAAVAGDAVWSDEAAHAFRTAADAVGAHWHSWPDRFRAGMKAALAQDRAAQGAAPSAPVGVEWPLSLLRAGNWREVYVGHRCMRLEVTYEHAAWERLMEQVEAALAQQPAAVDEAMVERALNAYFADQCQLVDKESKLFRAMKAALTAALAAQPGEE